MDTVITATNLHKTYGSVTAVDNISLSVERGQIFGIVGPNGAGKTTTVEMVMGLRQPDRGEVRVLGLDPQQDRKAVRERIGVQLQQAQVQHRLKVWEILKLFSSFYKKTVPYEPLLEQWGLSEKRNAKFTNLSGGQKQRLFIALALINDPEIVVLDELTTGLDPQARRATWDLIKQIRDQGKTVILVTHFMDEAELLCDQVAIIDSGKIVVQDSPAALIRSLNAPVTITFTSENGFDPELLKTLPEIATVTSDNGKVTVTGGNKTLAYVSTKLADHGLVPSDLRQNTANLEDVFLALTGKQIRS